MSDPSTLEMIAELQRAQSESILDNQNESENIVNHDHLDELNLDPITDAEIYAALEFGLGPSKFNADGYN